MYMLTASTYLAVEPTELTKTTNVLHQRKLPEVWPEDDTWPLAWTLSKQPSLKLVQCLYWAASKLLHHQHLDGGAHHHGGTRPVGAGRRDRRRRTRSGAGGHAGALGQRQRVDVGPQAGPRPGRSKVDDQADPLGATASAARDPLKGALDPQGILAPGKSGIWPQAGAA